jgi:hypothetical protein
VTSVAENLLLFRGVWHDQISAYAPTGVELTEDPLGGSPGPVPYEQLVYLDIEGDQFIQTNVVLRGRDPHARTFRGSIVDGVLIFDRLGPNAPEMVGVSGGPGVLVFAPRRIDEQGTTRFHDPDYIRHLGGNQRTRTTTLYRDGELVRVLTVMGTRISSDPTQRVSQDPRGATGPVHQSTTVSDVYSAEEKS